jgi:hypothetical protein
MLARTATIGAVRLAVPIRATSSSAAAMPACSPAAEQSDSLCVASRIEFSVESVKFESIKFESVKFESVKFESLKVESINQLK